MRLINADALIQALEKKHEHWHELVSTENKEIEFAHQYAVNVIQNAPTVKEASVYEYVKDMDGITYCDVVESCEECPRYGDDCDGRGEDDE